VVRERGRNRSGEATRQRILEAATALFAAGGYEATSLRQIAGAASVDLATLKYHVDDKPTLFAEVYRHGHAELIGYVEPVLALMSEVRSTEEMRASLRALVKNFHDFVEDNLPFVRMVLYRMLEDPANMSALENELQGLAIAMADRTFDRLIRDGIIRPIDTRALISFLVMALPMFAVTCEVKPQWLGEPNPVMSEEGRQRSEAFFGDVLDRYFLS